MIPRTNSKTPTDMLTSAYYNDAKYVGRGGYYKGNKNYQCCNYAMGRTCEIAKRAVTYYDGISKKSDVPNTMFNRSGYGNAKNWYADTYWEKGSKARVGAVMVYGSNWGGGYGHVRVVEKIDGNRIFYSAGNEYRSLAFKWIDMPKVSANGFLGYIYNPYVMEDEGMLLKFNKSDEYEYKWSVDGNKYGEAYDVTTQGGFSDPTLVKEGWELVLKVNGSLFYTYDGKHYACGLEKCFGDNHQDVGMTAVSDYNSCMAVAGLNDELIFGSQNWIINNVLNEAYCAISGMGLIMNGKIRTDMHKGFESQWDAISGRTVIGEDKDGNFMSYSLKGETGKSGITGIDLANKCLTEYHFYNAILLDGGGSVFRQYRNKEDQLIYDITSSRKVKNALLLYRRKKQAEPSINWEEKYNEAIARINALEQKVEDIKAEKQQAEELLSRSETVITSLYEKMARIKEICE